MPFDGIVTRAVALELKEMLLGGRVDKIYQPTNTELSMTIRSRGQNVTVLFSIHPSYFRLHITEAKFQNPETPPMFCMVLRKHLQGARIESIKQHELERIVTFHFKTLNEIGDEEEKTLIVELMGKHSNVILVNEQKQMIIDCIKHVPPTQNSYRTLLPGAAYKLPPTQNKLSLLEADEEQFIRKIDFNSGQVDRQIVNNITGISPMIAKEFIQRAHLGAESAFKREYRALKEEVLTNEFTPAIYENKREDFHVIDISYMTKKQLFTSTSNMIDTFYKHKAERDLVHQLTRDVQRIVRNELKKNERKKRIHEQTLQKAQRKNDYQKMGELLTAYLHLVKQGDASVRVIDYYDPEQRELVIELETDVTPSENAQRYFTQYKKLVHAEKRAEKELQKVSEEIDYLETILQQIELANLSDIAEIREELEEGGYIKKQKKRKKKSQKPEPEKFTASDGTTIYVGKNNRQNDYVTQRLAHKEDTWLHTQNIPGSHVVIKSAEPSEQTIIEAAKLAAYFSKAQQSESVPVDYTKIKYVQKPTGAKPGFVTYRNFQTVFVTPSKEIVDQLQYHRE